MQRSRAVVGSACVAAGVLAVALGAARAEAQRPVSVRLPGGPIRLISAPAGMHLRTEITLRNGSRAMIYYDGGCGPWLQRETARGWEDVWHQICSLVKSQPRALPPGDSVVVHARFYGYTLPNWQPRVDPRVHSGLYRFVVGAVGSTLDRTGWEIVDQFSGDQRATAPFVLLESPTPEMATMPRPSPSAPRLACRTDPAGAELVDQIAKYVTAKSGDAAVRRDSLRLPSGSREEIQLIGDQSFCAVAAAAYARELQDAGMRGSGRVYVIGISSTYVVHDPGFVPGPTDSHPTTIVFDSAWRRLSSY